MRALGIALLASLASCDGCTERTPGVCCTSDPECARLGLPPGSVADYSCGADHVCRDFYCVPEEPADAPADVAIDAPSGRCNPNAPFSAPTRLANVNTPFEELDMVMTADELTAFFLRFDSASLILQTSSRRSAEDDFPTPTVAASVAAIESTYDPIRISVSGDGLALYFRNGSSDVYAAYRPSPNVAFTSASRVLVDGSPIYAHLPKISVDSRTLYWTLPNSRLRAATRTGTYETFVSGRDASIFEMTDFAISADDLTLYYSNFPYPDVFVTTRASKNVPFDVGVPVSNVNTSDPDVPLSVTSDGCLLYIRSNRSGSDGANDYWVARRLQ